MRKIYSKLHSLPLSAVIQACLRLTPFSPCPCREEFEGHLEYDLGNLMACDSSLQDAQALSGDREAHCLEAATQITQSLVSRLFKLPGQAVGMGRVVSLPAPTFPLPRQKPMPTPRPPTR